LGSCVQIDFRRIGGEGLCRIVNAVRVSFAALRPSNGRQPKDQLLSVIERQIALALIESNDHV
jgi:hypothetical protein